jgi:coenzyme Q-binding protein COQ10
MFALVADVERYPEFVPLCEDLRITAREATDDGEILTADMTVAYKMFQETFTSKVTLKPSAPEVLVEYLSGPFRHLENRWTFKELSGGQSEICFFIAYEFRSRALQLIAGAVFDRAFRRFAQAFEQRADAVYGRPAGIAV